MFLVVATILVVTVPYTRFYSRDPFASSPVIAANDMRESAGVERAGKAGELQLRYGFPPDSRSRPIASFPFTWPRPSSRIKPRRELRELRELREQRAWAWAENIGREKRAG